MIDLTPEQREAVLAFIEIGLEETENYINCGDFAADYRGEEIEVAEAKAVRAEALVEALERMQVHSGLISAAESVAQEWRETEKFWRNEAGTNPPKTKLEADREIGETEAVTHV